MYRKLLKTVQTITTFRDPLADPVGTRRGPLWSADPSLKTADYCTLAPGVYRSQIQDQSSANRKCYDFGLMVVFCYDYY